MTRRLAGQSILITGAAQGIGAEVAGQLVRRGASVMLVDIDDERLRAVAAELGPLAIWAHADVTDLASLEVAVALATERFGGLDAVMANAGIEALGSVASMDPGVADRVVEVDLLGVWRTVRASLPALIASRGYVLLVSSLSATSAGPLNAPYNAAKAGVVALAKTLRLEVAEAGVAVGVAYFSYIGTETARRAVEDPLMADVMARMPKGLMRPIPVERAAAAVVRGIERRARRVVVPGGALVSVLFPELAQRLTEIALRPRRRG